MPSTTTLARNSSERIFIRAAGSTSVRLPKSAVVDGSATSGPGCASERRHRLEQAADQALDVDAVGLRAVAEKHAVPQHGRGQRADVVGADVKAPLEQRARLGPQ